METYRKLNSKKKMMWQPIAQFSHFIEKAQNGPQ